MARIRTYLRIAPTSRGYKVSAHRKQPSEPHRAGYDALPTVVVCLDLTIPAEAWNVPVIRADVPVEMVEPIVEVVP